MAKKPLNLKVKVEVPKPRNPSLNSALSSRSNAAGPQTRSKRDDKVLEERLNRDPEQPSKKEPHD
jgi:hypothetical protein